MKRRVLAVAVALSVWSLVAGVSRAQFDAMVKHVPDSANTLVLVNAAKLFASPVAQRQGWQANRQQRFAAGLTAIPPQAGAVAIATQLDLEAMRPVWEVGVVEFDSPVLLATIARQLGGVLDMVTGLQAVRLPDNSFIVELSPRLRGAMVPANRQQVARWLGESDGHLSPYLQQAVRFAENQSEIIIALDLTESVTADEVAHRMGANMDVYQDILRQSPLEPKDLAELLASIKGVMLGVTFRDEVYGKIRVDFGSDASKLAPIAKPLLLAVIGHQGAMIDDFADWTAAVEGTQVTLGGKLSASGVMRLSSLVELPTQGLHRQTEQPTTQEAPANEPKTMLQATQEYFQATENLMRDLRSHKGEAKTIGTIGMWFENYARKIERLPMLNVDKEMLDYGVYLANQLRNASMAIKGAGIRTRPEEMAASSAAGGGGFSFGGGYGVSAYGSSADYVMARAAGNSPEMAAFNTFKAEARQEQAARLQVRANEKAQAATSVQGIMAQIATATTQVRRDMTEKYQVNF